MGNSKKGEQGSVQGASGGFGHGAHMAERPFVLSSAVPGCVTGRFTMDDVRKPTKSVRPVSFVNRQTARKLLDDTVKELRKVGVSGNEAQWAAADFGRWADNIEAALGLTVGEGW